MTGQDTLAPRLRRIGLALLAALVALTAWQAHDALTALLAWIRDAGAAGMVVFVAAYVAACVLFLPGSILTMGAGLVYGVAIGLPLAWTAATLGATVAFVLGRTLARDLVARRVAGAPRFAAIDRAVARSGLRIVLLTRLSPVFPFNLLNYAYGLTGVTLRDYVVGSIGMLPGTLLYVYLGSLATTIGDLAAGDVDDGVARRLVQLLGFAATVAVTVTVTRVARRALDEETGHGARSPMGEPPAHGTGEVVPDDVHNRDLVAHVHPRGRINPRPRGRYNLVVLGGGTAGLVSAAGAAGLGARVALVERHLMGGDCLNVGCVPSKALLRAARAAADARAAGEFGVRVGAVDVDFAAVMERMRRLRAEIAPHDGVERFTALGVDVLFGHGRFTSPTTIEVDGRRLEFSRAVIATGGRPAALPIPGLADAGYLTNETVFSLTSLPRRLVVIGAGPIGCELAQAFRRFGAAVTVIHDLDHVLPRADPEAATLIERRFAAEGITVWNRATIRRIDRRDEARHVEVERDGHTRTAVADAILLAVGRRPNIEGLGLESAGIAWSDRGVTVDDHLRTSNRRVYAAGDVASAHRFTHAADALARIVLRNALFLGRRRASTLTIPWCTYTSPEVAHVGLSEAEARARGLTLSTITVPLSDVDRALLDGDAAGFLKVHVRAGTDRILGATLVAAHAGEIIGEIAVAMAGRVGLGTIAETIHPYPTQAEVVRKAADAWNRGRLTPRVRRLFERWLAWRR